MLVDKKCWHPENQNLHQLNGLHQHTEPGNKQHEVQQNAPHDQGHLCDLGDIQLPEEKQQDQQKIVDLKASMKEEGLQQNSDLPSPEKSFLPSGCFGSSNSEMLMEIEVVEQSIVSVLKSTCSQNANVENIEFTAPESNIEMSGTNNEYGNSLPTLSLCGSCQPSVESTEESCSSVTAALKELHELLVSSSKPAPENTSKVICQSETIPEGQKGVKDFSERWTQNDHLPHREPCPQVFCHQASSVSVKSESLGAVPGTGTEDTEDSSSQGPSDGLSADKDGVPRSTESVSESSSVTITSAESSNQLHCTLGVEISPSLTASEDALSQTSEQTESLPSSFILVKDLGHGIQNLATDRPETRENACPDTARPFLELDPLTSHLSSPSLLSPLIFPATDIDRILWAGFTLQEALGALHRVGGNADLALLVLLAKNIVVAT
ncbi:Regulatory solute carrier protein family 1 member 1 [Heterocephalus glaber]|uniref:Regulatory solute carrier protein family 1 member 1 n=1 Tax=Heterocephalus glaber TaxID=10181 RepID=G5BA25_HETGA|nr:Regulatory solute carrier protein family 1 member 1 [Heterocephalus glaber]